MSHFIFMLTNNDVTVSDARAVFSSVSDLPIPYVGFKDIGLPESELKALAQDIRANGQQVMLEVVSENREDEIRSIQAGINIGVDYILGGTNANDAVNILDGSGITYMPFPGRIEGHPSKLCGTLEEITESALRLSQTPGVSGLDLLAYRYLGNVESLIGAVVDAVDCPVVIAGSIASAERIQIVRDLGPWAFTVGSAVFASEFEGEKTLRGQLTAILDATNNKFSAQLATGSD